MSSCCEEAKVDESYCKSCGRVFHEKNESSEGAEPKKRNRKRKRILDPLSLTTGYWFERQEISDLLRKFLIDPAPKRVAEESIRRGMRERLEIQEAQAQYSTYSPTETEALTEAAIQGYASLSIQSKRKKLSAISIASWYLFAQRKDCELAHKLNWSLVSFRALDGLGYDKRLTSAILKKLVAALKREKDDEVKE